MDSEVKITSERTYACHLDPHQIDIGVLHHSEGERVCWKANTEGDHPKVNPAEGLHVLCVCRVFGRAVLMLYCGPCAQFI